MARDLIVVVYSQFLYRYKQTQSAKTRFRQAGARQRVVFDCTHSCTQLIPNRTNAQDIVQPGCQYHESSFESSRGECDIVTPYFVQHLHVCRFDVHIGQIGFIAEYCVLIGIYPPKCALWGTPTWDLVSRSWGKAKNSIWTFTRISSP